MSVKSSVGARLRLASYLLLITLSPLLLKAASYQLPPWAGTPDSQIHAWDVFTTAVGSPGNPPDIEGSSPNAIVTQTTPGATVTGTGNIYNPAAASAYEITPELTAPAIRVVLHVQTSGTELDYSTVLLKLGDQTGLSADQTELQRVSTGFGDTVLSRWEWDLAAEPSANLSLAFSAAGSHSSLATARLDIQFGTAPISVIRESDLDRWSYPFNATPGTRAVASAFASPVEGVGLQRHALFAFGFLTAPEIPSGLPASHYEILEARVLLTTSANFQIEYDPTPDPVLSFLPLDHADVIPDPDLGRPMELFGAGFRNGFTSLTWEETSPYSVDDTTTVHPIGVANESLADATMNVLYDDPFEIKPFAIGHINDLTPGEFVPEDTQVQFDLDLGDPAITAYLQQALRDGRLLLTAASLHRSGRDARTFPEFYTRDSLIGTPPTLELSVRLVTRAPQISILALHFQDGQPALQFQGQPGTSYQIRHTSDYSEWHTVSQPEFATLESGILEWRDTDPSPSHRFYQVVGFSE